MTMSITTNTKCDHPDQWSNSNTIMVPRPIEEESNLFNIWSLRSKYKREYSHIKQDRENQKGILW